MLTADPLLLLLKMTIAASIVVVVSIIAEKSKPFIAAMVATLPVSAGPALAFIALDHDDAFMRETLTGALIQNITTGLYCLAFAVIAQRNGTVLSLGGALAVWALAGLALKTIGPGLWGGLLLSILIYPLLMRAARPYLAATMPPIPPRPWYAIPMRATGVAVLVAAVTTLSFVIGPYGSGLLAVLPIVLSSLVIILQPRIGGPAMARIIVSGLPGLFGFAFALALAAVLSEPLGRFNALGIGLAVTLVWNGALVVWQRVRA
jgi:uncharacterized membrane protein (GlpM family)